MYTIGNSIFILIFIKKMICIKKMYGTFSSKTVYLFIHNNLLESQSLCDICTICTSWNNIQETVNVRITKPRLYFFRHMSRRTCTYGMCDACQYIERHKGRLGSFRRINGVPLATCSRRYISIRAN